MVYEEGTVLFVDVVNKSFKMMNVKYKYAAIKHRDDSRSPWTLDCATSHDLHAARDVIASCHWNGTGNTQQKLTKFTADAFLTTTKFNIAAASMLCSSLVTSIFCLLYSRRTHWNNFSGKQDSGVGENFYVDIADVVATAKVQKLQLLLKLDILPEANTDYQ